MTVDEFVATLDAAAPPHDATPVLRALWLARKGDWEAAHALVGDLETRSAASLHAYLHREEGDLENARYWYQQAGRPVATGPLDEEWSALAAELVPGGAER
jgi:hypothetical protein